jgi:hydrogenase nickel incorporation protein HypA/HybF
MHELAVTENVLEIALRHAAQAGASRVTDVYLTIGQLASIVDASVQFYWDFVAENTPAAGAQLHFERIPAELTCSACGARFGLDGKTYVCPQCGAAEVSISAGEEFFVAAIEVER